MQIIQLKPDGLVIGESIIDADDPAQEAASFAQLCK
jgi:3-keto-L-gulonate-6-phosphate decarboxylase